VLVLSERHVTVYLLASEAKEGSPLPKAQPRSTSGRSASPVGEKIDPKLALEQQRYVLTSLWC
jgi:hypothetical protein